MMVMVARLFILVMTIEVLVVRDENIISTVEVTQLADIGIMGKAS